ncbi:unnamed protein product [Prorocentrum cordatum]|uniref:ADP,ATP carrier protein n=1 Tax=Prorocentrum cordatum TaxID=2364126 RepID=A0ABN9RN83_9DINO|nr:unnamed protein product [Polarella glacialis]
MYKSLAMSSRPCDRNVCLSMLLNEIASTFFSLSPSTSGSAAAPVEELRAGAASESVPSSGKLALLRSGVCSGTPNALSTEGFTRDRKPIAMAVGCILVYAACTICMYIPLARSTNG